MLLRIDLSKYYIKKKKNKTFSLTSSYNWMIGIWVIYSLLIVFSVFYSEHILLLQLKITFFEKKKVIPLDE